MKLDEQAAQPAPAIARRDAQMQLVLVTGMSGSGKSVALKVLEDSGYYCVDNLPAHLLPGLADFLARRQPTRAWRSAWTCAAGTTLEGSAGLGRLSCGARSIDLRVLFLDAKTDTLVKRFSETRRRHPLSDDTRTLPECIEAERELLAEVSALAHHVDTSDLSPHALRAWVKDFVGLPALRADPAVPVVRLQERRPARCRSRVRRALPAQSALRPAAAPDDRAGRSRSSSSCARTPIVQNMLRRHLALPRRVAALLHPRQSQLPHRRHRLHRRAPPLGLSRRGRWRSASARWCRCWCAIASWCRCEACGSLPRCCACTAPATTLAEWVRVSTIDINQHWYDRSKIFVDGDLVTYWRRVAFRVPQRKQIRDWRRAPCIGNALTAARI